MKRNFFLLKHEFVLISIALLITSCDGLLPKKISDEKTEGKESFDKSSYAIEEEVEDIIIDEELLPPPPPPPSNNYDNDVSSMYAEHDYGVMDLYEFYSEKYFGDGQYNPDRFLSKRLKLAIEGINRIERKTGDLILDYDPFIQAQSVCFSEGQFTVERNGSSDWFTFRYKNTCVQLFLIESGNGYLIDDIKLPSGETLIQLYEEEKRSVK